MRHLINICLYTVAFCVIAACSSVRKGLSNHNDSWVGTWATAPQLVESNNMPPAPGLSGNTLRQVVRVSVGGKRIRLRLSNMYSKDSLYITEITVAKPTQNGNVTAASITPLLFSGKTGFAIGPGADIYSDPVAFDLAPNALLAISICYGNTTHSITGHPGSRTTSFMVMGNQARSAEFKNPLTTDHWYSIMNVDVQRETPSAAIAIMGNSITDGRGSGTNQQNRWPDILSQRLLANPATQNISVLNFGIGGNCVVRGGLGPTALARFDYNILHQSGVRWLIILEGINDIGGIKRPEDAPTRAKELTEAYQVMIDKAHANGIKVYGATLLPFARSFYDSPFRQDAWNIVNDWIRTSGKFDAVIDFDRLMESDEAGVILPGMHDGDHLHPNEAGYKRMGEFVPLDLFSIKE